MQCVMSLSTEETHLNDNLILISLFLKQIYLSFLNQINRMNIPQVFMNIRILWVIFKNEDP